MDRDWFSAEVGPTEVVETGRRRSLTEDQMVRFVRAGLAGVP
jgi:hypothetical protein